ncbi:MAG: TaqI-like C-terminal specificity domain-containing protein [Anaerolineales bacterium]
MAYTFDQSKDEIARLVKHFETNRAAYLATAYNEAQARQEFIDPLFIALNWDVHNQQQAAPDYRDVVVEYSLEMEAHEARKAPDYVFRVGHDPKFFAEAKRPGVDLKTSTGPAYQLRRYAWSAKLPLSVLTDFQEWAAYDCRIRPSEKDKSSVARLAYLTYEEYADRWHEIWDIYSRDAVWGGSFDQFAQGSKAKRGTSEVDAEFLKEIEGWRNSLAHNIALRNPDISLDELNDSVQRTIDRIIFLRMVEDRGMEEYGQLQRIGEGEDIYSKLLALSKKADAKYNSGLFDFTKSGDQVTSRLAVDDKPLKSILADLYYPQPYEFRYLPVEILGNIYEQFLGKVIKFTPTHHAKVEEKPEVKKAGGVYYTPSYIVEYIVKNTVGKQIEGKSPAQLNGFRVLDPACGSGSFLLGAYTLLLEYYHDWYIAHEPGKHKEAVAQQPDGSWQLTLPERKRILTEHIYGVDIDRQAVEVTKLSLLLKVLEGLKQLTLFNERALPNLDSNIKCGNSLIGPDYFAGQMMPDDDELRRVNPFDWQQGFPAAIKEGGFDCVIGNPPYVRQETIAGFKDYFETHYQVYDSIADLFAYFIECSLRITREHGFFSYIVSNKFVRAGYGNKLRSYLSQQGIIHQFIDFGDLPVFLGATVYPCILVIEKESTTKLKEDNQVVISNVKSLSFRDLSDYVNDNHFTVPQSTLMEGVWHLQPTNEKNILEKIAMAGQLLPEYCGCEPLFGVKTGLNEVFIVTDTQIDVITKKRKSERGIFLPYLRGRNVKRYGYEHTGEYLLFTDGITDTSHPNVMSYLRDHRAKLEARTDIKNTSKKWYELRPCSYYDLLRKPKIIYASVAQRGTFVLDEEGTFVDKTCYFIPSDDKYLLGLLNSKMMFYYFASLAVQRRGGYFEYLTQYVVQLPIRSINNSNVTDKSLNDKMVALVDQMLDLHKRQAEAIDATEQERLQRVIDSTDQQIDALVYELYELTPEEIAIVEETTVKHTRT